MHKVLAENELKRLLKITEEVSISSSAKQEGRAPAEPKSGGGGGSQIAVTEDEHLISNYCNISIFYQDFLLFFP